MSNEASMNSAQIPFTEYGKPVPGQPYTIPAAKDILQPIADVPGYGCFLAPNLSVGMPLSTDPKEQCPKGYFCPYIDQSIPSKMMVACPSTPSCELARLGGVRKCLPQGLYEPTPCFAGFYCPTVKEIYPCPAGYQCPTGTYEPIPCQPFSICPTGTIVQRHYGFLLLFLAIDVVVIIFVAIYKYRSKRFTHVPLDTLPTDNTSSLNYFYKKGLCGQKEASINYSFQDLKIQLPSGKMILSGVSGKILSGRMTAIMGPSGAGKSTLMNGLMGKINLTSGDLEINNEKATVESISSLIGYVPQDDVMLREMTVKEILMFSASVRLSPNIWTKTEIEKFVDAVIDALDLKAVCDSVIGDEVTRGISGGQRKRVSIAMELVANEPTSGLDSTSSLKLVMILKNIASLGLNIISVIHQPRVEIFNAFDDVILLVPGGQTAYVGPILGAQPYFEDLGFIFESNANPADVLMDILSGQGTLSSDHKTKIAASHLVKAWSDRSMNESFNSEKGEEMSTCSGSCPIQDLEKISKARGSSILSQFSLALKRSVLQQYRTWGSFAMEIFIAVFSGVCMGMTVSTDEPFNGILKGAFMVLSGTPKDQGTYGVLIGIAVALSAAPSAVKVFGEEKVVYWRERDSGHNSLAYYLGKTISVLPRIILAAGHFTAFYYFLARPAFSINVQFALVLLNFFGIYGMSAIVSMVVRRENAAMLAVFCGLIFSMFSGYSPSLLRAKNYSFLFTVSVDRWAAEAQFGLAMDRYSDVYDTSFSAGIYGYELGKVERNLALMFLLGILYRVVAFIALVLLKSKK